MSRETFDYLGMMSGQCNCSRMYVIVAEPEVAAGIKAGFRKVGRLELIQETVDIFTYDGSTPRCSGCGAVIQLPAQEVIDPLRQP
jgi:hypothetical protein